MTIYSPQKIGTNRDGTRPENISGPGPIFHGSPGRLGNASRKYFTIWYFLEFYPENTRDILLFSHIVYLKVLHSKWFVVHREDIFIINLCIFWPRSVLNRFALDVIIASVSESIRSLFAELPTVLITIFPAAATERNFAPYISMNLTACSVSLLYSSPSNVLEVELI